MCNVVEVGSCVAPSFGSISQEWLIRFLDQRIGDKRIICLIQKWLQAGILEGGIVMVATAAAPAPANPRTGEWLRQVVTGHFATTPSRQTTGRSRRSGTTSSIPGGDRSGDVARKIVRPGTARRRLPTAGLPNRGS
jgi:hypothetical protein